jgi:hypothetical protein
MFRFGRIVALYAIVTNPFANDQPNDNATAEGRNSE